MIRHNAPRNTMSCTISLKSKSVMWVASSILWQDMKCTLLENLSTTTKIESLPFFELDKPKTKSIKISTQGALGTGKWVYNPCGKTLDLAYLRITHLAQTLSTSHFIFGLKKWSCNMSKVFLTPKWSVKLPLCASLTSN